MLQYLNPIIKPKIHDNILPSTFTIYVDNVTLTVNYYREYLGFKLINTAPKNGNMKYALMSFGKQNILFEEDKTESLKSSFISLNLNLSKEKMHLFYNQLVERVRIYNKFTVNEKGIASFSILDCNGYQINFSGCIDYQLEALF